MHRKVGVDGRGPEPTGDAPHGEAACPRLAGRTPREIREHSFSSNETPICFFFALGTAALRRPGGVSRFESIRELEGPREPHAVGDARMQLSIVRLLLAARLDLRVIGASF